MDTATTKVPGPVPKKGFNRPGILSLVPWEWVGSCCSSATGEEMTALFRAYSRLNETIDVEEILSGIPQREDYEPCQRCGRCCARLLPEPGTEETVLIWKEAGNPARWFHSPAAEGPLAGRFYTGWFHEGVRLRMCPLLLRDPSTGDKFCVVYHLGPGHRPPACEGFRANWPHCEVSQRPLVP